MSSNNPRGMSFPEQQQRPQAGRPGFENRGQSGMGQHSSSGTMENVKEKAGDMLSGASEMAGQVKEKAQEWASNIADTAGQAWDGTKQGAQQVAHTAEEAWESFTSFLRRYPVASLVAAVGIGFCLSEMLRSRR